jgi:hypothetical protein
MKTGLIDASGHSIAEVRYDSIAMDSIGAYNMCKLYLCSGFILMGRNFLPISDQPIDDFYTVTFPGYTNTWKKQEAEPILVYRIGDKYGIFNMSEPDMEMSAMYDYKVTRLVTISGTDFVQLEQDSTLLGYADLYGNYFWKRE